MEPLEMRSLQAHALRAYEWSRWRAALRVVAVILPVVLLSALLGTSVELCACTAVLVIPVAVMLRWYGQGFGNAATHGVLVGGAAAMGVLVACEAGLLGVFARGVVVAACACCGLVAGIALARWVALEHRERVGARALTAAGVASAMMSLGCAEGGFALVAAFGIATTLAAGVGALLAPATSIGRQP